MKAIDLFCGCGGMSPGFRNAGFDIIAAYDHWDPAVNVYKKNCPICQAERLLPSDQTEIIPEPARRICGQSDLTQDGGRK